MNNQPAATIVFVYRERLSSTLPCLEHLLAVTGGAYQLICVDGGAPESIAGRLRELAAQHGFRLIRSAQYLSPNESRNLALPRVQTRYVAFVDNDVKVGQNWLEPLVRCAEETGAWLVAPLYMQSHRGELRVHMFGGTVRVRDEQGQPGYSEDHHLAHQLLNDSPNGQRELLRRETELIEFHALLMDMEAYRSLGPLDEKFFSCSEHADLSLAVKKAGKAIYLEPASVITYEIPERLENVDREYFALRWSEAWTQASVQRMAEKYAIPMEDAGLRKAGGWARGHRQGVLSPYPRVRGLLGPAWHQRFRKRIAQPLEKWRSLRRYSPAEYVMNRKAPSAVISG